MTTYIRQYLATYIKTIFSNFKNLWLRSKHKQLQLYLNTETDPMSIITCITFSFDRILFLFVIFFNLQFSLLLQK